MERIPLESAKDKHYRERKSAEYLLISQPNCGRTWLRMMIGKAMQLAYDIQEIKLTKLYYFSELNNHIPAIKVIHERYEQFGSYENKKIILLVRDPRDAIISRYFSERHQQNGLSLSDFIWQTNLVDDYICFYNTWLNNIHIPKAFLLVFYEGLKRKPLQELKRVCNFIGIKINEKIIKEAVEYASFENMRKMELEGKIGSGQKKDLNNPETLKVRKGKVGGYRDYLNTEDVQALDRKICEHLDPFYLQRFPLLCGTLKK
ncbi:MAG: sulfotransferase domain-containing protein [Symploca sp. SIO2B6]|nr:sulfotransferase domain-containing protein [Symploca sp. SIO2B6]